MGARFIPYGLALFLLGSLIAAACGLLVHLDINNAPEVYFPSDAPAVVAEREVRGRFPENQVLVALFEGRDLLSDRFLTGLDAVARRLAANDRVERVLTVTNVDHIRGAADGFAVEPLLSPKIAASLTQQERRVRLLSDRFAPGRLVSKDLRAMALIVRPTSLASSLERLALERAVREAITDAGLGGRLTGMTANIALDVAELRSMLRDTVVFVPATTLLGLALVWWMFRRALAVVVTFVTTSAISLSTVALLVATDSPLTLISAMIAPLMTALSIALLVHLFNMLRREASRGHTGEQRIARALSEVRRPARYTALTTAAGLGSLAVSSIQPVKQFGLVTAVGVLLLYGTVVWLLPPVLLRWDRAQWRRPGTSGRVIDLLATGLAKLGIRYAGWVVLASVVLLALGIPQLWRIHSETDVYKFFGPRHPITLTTKRVGAKLSGVATIQVLFRGPGRDSLQDPKRLAVIEGFQKWLDQQPEVDLTTSMVDVIEEMNWAFHGERPEFRRLPTDGALVSQYLFIYDGTDLYDMVDHEFDRTLLTANLNVRGANATGEVIDRIRRHLAQQGIGDLHYEVAGVGRLFADQEVLLINGQIRSLWSALGLIFLFMLALFRSVRDAVLCMIPNISPVLFIFVFMGTFGIWLDMATAMVASVAVGIAVDDTIHLYHGYKARLRLGAPKLTALMRSYHGVGQAVVITTVILSGQFFLLTLSDFVPTTEFGLLTAVGLVTALLFDLLLLPSLVVCSWRLSSLLHRGLLRRARGGK